VIQKLQIVEQERNNLISDLRVGEENYKSIIKDHLRLTGVIQDEFINSEIGNKIIEYEMRKRNIIQSDGFEIEEINYDEFNEDLLNDDLELLI
jgi:trans-2-enoyl-CoA reductase